MSIEARINKQRARTHLECTLVQTREALILGSRRFFGLLSLKSAQLSRRGDFFGLLDPKGARVCLRVVLLLATSLSEMQVAASLRRIGSWACWSFPAA